MTRPSDALIRQAAEADLDAVLDLWEDLIALHTALDERFWRKAPDGRAIMGDWLRQGLSQDDRVLLVAEVDGRVVGFAHATFTNTSPPMVDRRVGLITDVVVSASHRRRGIGRRLMEAGIQRLRDLDAEEIRLSVAPANEPALALYRGLGFEVLSHTLCLWPSGD